LYFDLNFWAVIRVGFAGSILGHYMLTLYIPYISNAYFKLAKNTAIMFLGQQLKMKGWKSQMAIFLYFFISLVTNSLFVAGGMSRIKSLYIFPLSFLVSL